LPAEHIRSQTSNSRFYKCHHGADFYVNVSLKKRNLGIKWESPVCSATQPMRTTTLCLVSKAQHLKTVSLFLTIHQLRKKVFSGLYYFFTLERLKDCMFL